MTRGGSIDRATARAILRALVGRQALRPGADWPPAATADWLITHDLMGIAYRRLARAWPALAAALRPRALDQLGANSVLFDDLARLIAQLEATGAPLVLLKGAALAIGTYDDLIERPMTDIDIWVRADTMPVVIAALQALEFEQIVKDDRPLALNAMADGELQFWSPRWELGLIELHWSPFSGWWLKRTAAIDADALWARTRALPGYPAGVRRLAAEDQIIQSAVHNGVNHQFGRHALRHLVDVALLAQQEAIDWPALAERAVAWRLATVTWVTLALCDALIGLDGAEQALAWLAPRGWRRRLLARFVSVESAVAGRDVRGSAQRYLLLLLLVDRPRDALRLIGRTLLPERAWLAARYGQAVGYRHHLRQLLAARRV